LPGLTPDHIVYHFEAIPWRALRTERAAIFE